MQGKLLPDDKPNLELREVPLHQLPLDKDLLGQPPDRALIDSIERWGMLEPPTVYGTPPDPDAYPEGRYKVHDGRRRIKAQRILHREWAQQGGDTEEPNPYGTIKVFYADTEEAAAAFIGLTKQATRKANPAADIDLIEDLISKGNDERQIAAAVGMSVGTVKARINLSQNLEPELMQGLKDGLIKTSVAEAAAKLGHTIQRRLVGRYLETGKLKGTDVEEERKRRTESASKQISFDTPGLDDMGVPEDAAPLGSAPMDEAFSEEAETGPERMAQNGRRVEAAGYLQRRLAEIRSKDQAKWTRADMAALEDLLTTL